MISMQDLERLKTEGFLQGPEQLEEYFTELAHKTQTLYAHTALQQALVSTVAPTFMCASIQV